jgi:hypothetical protein
MLEELHTKINSDLSRGCQLIVTIVSLARRMWGQTPSGGPSAACRIGYCQELIAAFLSRQINVVPAILHADEVRRRQVLD